MGRITRWLQVLVPLALLVLGLVLALGEVSRSGDWSDFRLNLGTELVGAVAVYVLLQLVVGREATRRELIEQMGSTVHDVAIAAAEKLRRRGWLTDGSLQRARLGLANLQGAILLDAHLQGADLRWAHLQGARLEAAHLQGADLWRADLQGAKLGDADLQGAILGDADLRQASLLGAQLRGANLGGADLQEANLQDAKFGASTTFDENTILPDGTKWTPETDLGRFTDPGRSDFWRSDYRYSPAYRGRGQEQESD